MDLGRIGLLITIFALASPRAAVPQAAPTPTSAIAPPQVESNLPGAGFVPEDVSPATPTIRVTSRIVELDVVVSDGHGNPAKGLTKADFKLTEDGVLQNIDTFTERDAAPPSQPVAVEPQLPPNTFAVQPPVTGNGAVTVIVINSSFRWNPFFHGQLRDYFQTAGLTTPTAIFLIEGRDLHLIQSFTTNRERLVEAATSQRIWPVLGPAFGSDPASFRVTAIGTPTQHLAEFLAAIPGRINVVWIGGTAPVSQFDRDFPDQSTSLADVSSMVSSLNRAADVQRLSRIALYSITIGACGLGVPSTAQARPFGQFTVSGGVTKDQMEPQVNSVADAGRAFAISDLHNTGASTGGRDFWCTFPRQALQQITATGYHYYTISYHPTNPNWNGAYRHIHIDVSGYAQPPLTLRWSQLITGWADDVEPTLLYRQGYLARSSPPRDTSSDFSPAAPGDTLPVLSNTAPRAPLAPQRRLISVSPKGVSFGVTSSKIVAAMAFASLTPVDLHFTIAVTPEPGKEKIKAHDHLPTGNFLTTSFRDGPYRNYHIRYWIDPQYLRFVRNPSGLYHEDLKTIAVVYRDDGITANSLGTVTHLDLNDDDLAAVQASGVTLDQTIAIPTTEHFFLRALVSEVSTQRVGALEIPVEWIKLPPPNPQLASRPAP